MFIVHILVGVTMYVYQDTFMYCRVSLTNIFCSQPKDLALARRLRGERS
jgi:hypothetical protein